MTSLPDSIPETQDFIQEITCEGWKLEADGHIVRRNVESAEKEMRKASRGRVWDAMFPSS